MMLFQAKPAAAQVTLPSGFNDEKVVATPKPIALAPTPDGRMLVASQPGKLRVLDKNGQLLTTPALDLSAKMCANNDRGLLGVAVDPNFSTNGYVYLFYTHNKTGGTCPLDPADQNAPVNRVSRFVMSGDTVSPASEKVLIDNVPSGEHHNGGDLRFGKDSYLYATTGDGNCDYLGVRGCGGKMSASRDTNVLLGKVLRVTRDGDIPMGNPYTGSDSARCNVAGRTDPGKYCQETFASGLRNPFRFAFDPNAADTRFFIGDVGANNWEEIDEGEAGADYGWNLCEGTHDNPASSGSVNCSADPYTPPVHEWSHAETGCDSVTGQAFVPDGLWSTEYDDAYLAGDYVCNKIMKLTPKAGGGYERSDFAIGLAPGGPIAMTFGPHGSGQALYYATYANGGEIHRVTQSADANRAPSAAVTASPTSGDVPLDVSFDGSESSDPDPGDTLTYVWDFGDGSSTVETGTPTTNHAYAEAGTYTATLTVRDDSGAEGTATVRIDAGNQAPEPTIESPATTKHFKVGEQIMLQGSATDTQDGQLPESALSWEVLQHHNGSHTHPFSSGTGSTLTITAPPPEDGLHTTGPGNYLEILFTAKDSQGLTKTVTQELQPKRVNITLESEPTGLSLEVNNEAFVAPRTFVSWAGYELNVNAPSPQTLSGSTYAFDSWSNGGGQSQDILTGTTKSTYTATFEASSSCTITGTSGNDVLEGTEGDDNICGLGGNDTIKGLGGNDTLYGGDGSDIIEGGQGDDTMKGENNSDKLYGGEGSDTLDGGAGTDYASFKSSATGVQASLASNTATGEGSDTLVGIEHLEGSNFNDTLTGSGSANTLKGLGGVDAITGGDGNDTITGGAGNDTLYGGLGNDKVTGSGGADAFYGEDGDDTLNSRDSVSGNDSLDGGTGADTCTTDATEKSITSCP